MSDCGQLFRKVSLDFLWEVMQRQPRDISCGVSIEIYKTDGTTAEHGCLNNREGFLHRSELPLSHTASRRKLHIP